MQKGSGLETILSLFCCSEKLIDMPFFTQNYCFSA
jgi:hypothetical protein